MYSGIFMEYFEETLYGSKTQYSKLLCQSIIFPQQISLLHLYSLTKDTKLYKAASIDGCPYLITDNDSTPLSIAL